MIVSYNEIETTILKAAHGAGMEWGLAEEAAQSARFLSRFGLPFEAPFLRLLASHAWETLPILDGKILRPIRADAWLCPIRTGAFLSDLGKPDVVTIKRLISPILLLPFVERAKQKVELAWRGVSLRLDPPIFAFASTEPCALAASEAEEVSLSAGDGDAFESRSPAFEGAGAKVEQALWAKLQCYEALTYVPASAKSRASGAGAGEIDND